CIHFFSIGVGLRAVTKKLLVQLRLLQSCLVAARSPTPILKKWMPGLKQLSKNLARLCFKKRGKLLPAFSKKILSCLSFGKTVTSCKSGEHQWSSFWRRSVRNHVFNRTRGDNGAQFSVRGPRRLKRRWAA